MKKREKRWLIISYFANIDALAPSHHIDDRLLFFQKKGVDVHLLSSPCGAKYFSFKHTRVPSPAPSGIRYEVRHFLRRKTRTRAWFKFWETLLLLPVFPLYLIEKTLLRLDSTWSWFLTASVPAIILSIKNRPDIIYSTGGPVSAHLVAMVASFVTGIPYIAEFQDPLVHQYAAPGRFERHFIKKVERLIFGTADAAVFLTQRAADNARGRNAGGAKVFSLYAGACCPDNAAQYSREETFTVAHFGSLAGSRNLDYVLKTLAALRREQPDLSRFFRLCLFGNNGRDMQSKIERFSEKELLCVYGKVRRLEAVEHMHRADVLLLIQNTDDVSYETIPSKVYEYLLTGRPILALVYRNPELQGMLEGMGHIVVQADDEAAIKNGLETYITEWKQNRLRSMTAISPYTVERAVEKLIYLAEGGEDAQGR
jgi:glycosyltransferase involved in cell wall biosynthesis